MMFEQITVTPEDLANPEVFALVRCIEMMQGEIRRAMIREHNLRDQLSQLLTDIKTRQEEGSEAA